MCSSEDITGCTNCIQAVIPDWLVGTALDMPMYDLIKDIEDDIREALEDDSDEDNFFCGIIKNSEICMFDEFGRGIGVEINNADELTAMLASARLLSCEFVEKDGSDGR